MQTASPNSPGASIHDWFSKSGFAPISYETKHWGYAQRLSRYISDPSTVRARTLEQYGRAPTIDAIREMRADWLDKVKTRKETGYTAALKNDPKDMKQPVPEPANDEPSPETIVALALAEPEDEPETPTEVSRPTYPLLTAHDVIEACAAVMDVSYGEIVGSTRYKHIVEARMLTSAILRARGNSYPTIGRRINRDHSSVISSVRKFFSILADRPKLLAAWIKLAPCHAKLCRSLADVELVCGAARQ